MGVLLPITIVLFLTGLAALFGDNAAAVRTPTREAPKTATVQDFIVYRNAVLRYVENNRGVGASSTVTIAAPDLSLPQGATPALVPAGAGNEVVGNGTARTIYVWWPAGNASPARLGGAFAGDATMGVVNGSGWATASLGAMGPLPMRLPAGDLISVVELGGA